MESELAKILKDMYRNARDREAVSMIHLFGIRYANELRQEDVSVNRVVELSGIPISYVAEVLKGIKLAKFVRER